MALISPSRATGEVFNPVGRPVKFGFITDLHHDPIKTTDTAQGGKYYQDAVDKLTDIVAAFNARNDLSFVYQNGDFIDGSGGASAALVDLATIRDVFRTSNVPQYHCLGNHEETQVTKEDIMAVTGQPGKYYQFSHGGVTFIVLDGNFRSDDDTDDLSVSSGQTGVSPFISYVPPTQRAWLTETLAASTQPCVILCHYPLYYSGAFGWGLTNQTAVRSILEASGKVIGCLGGHLHDNYTRVINGIPYISLHATTAGAYPQLNYSIVSVYPKQSAIRVVSAGYEMSYIPA